MDFEPQWPSAVYHCTFTYQRMFIILFLDKLFQVMNLLSGIGKPLDTEPGTLSIYSRNVDSDDLTVLQVTFKGIQMIIVSL